MLFPQVPHEIKKKTATEFGVDLKFLVAKRKTESETEDNRIARLETVVSFIREYGSVGTVDEPMEYVEGTLPMRFAPAQGGLYLSGRTDTTIVGLGGSLTHLIGYTPIDHSPSPMLNSLAYRILRYLSVVVTESGVQASSTSATLDQLLNLERALSSEGGMPVEKIEFFAKRLLQGSASFGANEHLLLATPLYLAKAD